MESKNKENKTAVQPPIEQSAIDLSNMRQRPNVDPQAQMSVVALDFDWEKRSGFQVPRHLFFSDDDRQLGRQIEQKTYDTVTECMPVPCSDVFVLFEDEQGEREILTVVRSAWPLPDFRWMIGGRRVLPPREHYLSKVWNRYYDCLLVLFREAGLHPYQFEWIKPLCETELIFWRSVEREGEQVRERRCTPSFTAVAKVRGTVRPELELNFTDAQDALWLKAADLQNPALLMQFSDLMRMCFSAIFDQNVPLLSQEQMVEPQSEASDPASAQEFTSIREMRDFLNHY